MSLIWQNQNKSATCGLPPSSLEHDLSSVQHVQADAHCRLLTEKALADWESNSKSHSPCWTAATLQSALAALVAAAWHSGIAWKCLLYSTLGV